MVSICPDFNHNGCKNNSCMEAHLSPRYERYVVERGIHTPCHRDMIGECENKFSCRFLHLREDRVLYLYMAENIPAVKIWSDEVRRLDDENKDLSAQIVELESKKRRLEERIVELESDRPNKKKRQ